MRRIPGPIVRAALAALLLLVPASLAAAQSAGASTSDVGPGQDWRAFEANGRRFRLALPPGWSVEQTAPAAPGAEYELALLLPGEALLDYARISVRHMASPHRTVERALFALRHPAFGSPSAKAEALAQEIRRETLSPGVEAWASERSGERGLLGLADRVPVRKRTLIVPRPVGYFTLTMDVPEASLARVSPVFERLAREFRPLAGAGERGPELSAAEREVWAAFFAAKGRPGGGRPAGGKTGAPQPVAPAQAVSGPAASGPTASGVGSARDQLEALALAHQSAPPPPPPPDESLRTLADTGRAGMVAGRTLAAPTLDGAVLEELVRGCGGGGAAELLRAWEAVRGQRVLVTDASFVPGPEVEEAPGPERPAAGGKRAAKARPTAPPDRDEPDELAERGDLAGQAELMGRMSGQGRLAPPTGGGLLFSGGRAALSRVAFSSDGSLALAYVALRGTSPGLSHFVVFRSTGESPGGAAEGGRDWAVCGAALRDYIIY